MAIRILTRATFRRSTSTHQKILTFPNPKPQYFSTNPPLPNPFKVSPQSQYRKQISLANLFQRYGFPPSQLHNFLTKNHLLLNSNLHEIEKSLSILVSFKIPHNLIVSLICDCPGVLEFEFLKNWEIGLSEMGIGVLVLSPLAIKSVLEHSRRFQINPDGLSRSVRVLKGLGISDRTACRILEEFPRMIIRTESEIHKRIEFLVGIGIPKDEIDLVFSLFPGILRFNIENRLKPLLHEFRELGFKENVIRKEIVREPRILGMELGELSRCLGLLRTLKCRVPIKEKIFSGGAFRAGFEVKLRVDCLCKHGLIRREALKVLWKEPRLIMYDLDNIEKKIEFLVHRMKYDVVCLVEVPEYLGVNFEKQIVPRYNVIEYLRSIGGLGSEVGLRDFIKPSRLRFYNLYVKPYSECEKMFGRFSGDVEAKSQHPVGLWMLFKTQKYPQSKEDVKNIKSFMETLV